MGVWDLFLPRAKASAASRAALGGLPSDELVAEPAEYESRSPLEAVGRSVLPKVRREALPSGSAVQLVVSVELFLARVGQW